MKTHSTALFLLVLAYTLSIADRIIVSILYPDIQAEFGLSDTQLGLMGGLSFAVFYATVGVPIARLSDQYSRKLIIVSCLALFSLMTFVSGLATGFLMLLLMRVGVAIGEAGVNPASHSIIADYFPPQRRAFAMSVLMLGAEFGMVLAFVGGGFIAEIYNWRIALMVVGVPGLLLAAVMQLYLREPPRGAFESHKLRAPPPILTTAAAMWANPAMRHLVAGSVVAGMMSYGFAQWLPTFFMRSHDLSQSQAGMLMAGLFGVLGALGALLAGKLCDRLSKYGFQYSIWFIIAANLLSWPFMVMALLADHLPTAILLFAIPAFTANSYLGTSFALIQTLSPVQMRAVTSAIKMLFLNLIGMGFGPFLVGFLSDRLAPIHGESALSVAMAYFTLVGAWGVFHFYMCGKALERQAQLATYSTSLN